MLQASAADRRAAFEHGAARASKNVLLELARPLLVLGVRLRSASAPTNPVEVRQQAGAQIGGFGDQALAAGVPKERVLLARYLLCLYLDLAAFSTAWGARPEGEWMLRPLLVEFYRDNQGGREFSQLLERALNEPGKQAEIIDLLYLCLLLGVKPPILPGARPLAELESEAARVIRCARAVNPSELSPHWRPSRPSAPSERTTLLPWVAAIVAASLLFVLFVFYRAALADAARPYHLALLGGPAQAPLPVVARAPTRFADLLADRVQAKELEVDEVQGGVTRVRLIAPDVFASGSASVDPRYLSLIYAIGAAAEEVRGRLAVVGHTDDQPVHSFRYANNFELSEARAKAVAELLRQNLSDPSRVSWSGVGDTQPMTLPQDLPQNRARNRRVEIMYFEPAALAGGTQ